jgi:hypothetical protein
MMSFLDEKRFAFACGPQTPPHSVYLTWRIGKSGDTVGLAVAVEFVPEP